MLKKYILLLTGIAIVFNGLTQTFSISGKITDSITGKPLPDATVFLDNNPGSISSANGSFLISGLDKGQYKIMVRFLGYKDYSREVVVRKKHIGSMNIRMQKRAIKMNELTIRAGQRKQIKNKACRIDQIRSDQINTGVSQSFTEVLDYVPGVNVNNTTGIFSSKTVVSMRGLSGNDQSRVLIILDGVPLNKTDGGSVNWNQINRENIKEVIIHKGPGRAVYGSGAMGGVIEINTKDPKPGIHGNIKGTYGTYNTLSGTLGLNGSSELEKNRSVWWSVNASGTSSDGYITEDEQFYDIEDSILVPSFIKEYQLTGKLNYKMGKHDRISFKLGYFDDKRGNGVKVFEHDGAYSEHDTYSSMISYQRLKKNKQTELRIYFLHENYNRLYEYMNEGEYKLYDVDSKREDAGADLRLSFFNMGTHKLLTGLNLKNGSVDAADTYYTSTDIISNKGKMATGAFYIQDEIKILKDQFKLIMGFRYDVAAFYDALFKIEYPSYSIVFMDIFEDTLKSNKYWSALCPNISLQYNLNKSDRIFLTAGRGFRAPTLDDLTRTGKKRGTFKVANPSLKPELLDNFELGYDMKFAEYLNAGISAYYSIGHDFMYYVSTGDSVNMIYKTVPIIRKENISKVLISGVEINLDYELFNLLHLFTNYTYSYSEIKDFEIKDTLVDANLNGKHLTDVPNHKITGGVIFKYSGFTTNFNFKYIGKRWINDQNIVDDEYLLTDRYPAYTLFNLSIMKEFLQGFELSLNIENIFNKIYIDKSLQRCPGRMVYGGLSYRF